MRSLNIGQMNCHGHGKSATTNSKAGDYPKTFGTLTKIPKFLKIHHLVKRELFRTFHIYVSLLQGRSENVGKLQHYQFEKIMFPVLEWPWIGKALSFVRQSHRRNMEQIWKDQGPNDIVESFDGEKQDSNQIQIATLEAQNERQAGLTLSVDFSSFLPQAKFGLASSAPRVQYTKTCWQFADIWTWRLRASKRWVCNH